MENEYDRTILVVGNRNRFVSYIRTRLPLDLFTTSLPPSLSQIIINKIRYIHVYKVSQVYGHRTDDTSYTYIGPHWPQVETILEECSRFEAIPFPKIGNENG